MRNIQTNVLQKRFVLYCIILLLPQLVFSQILKSSKVGGGEKVMGTHKSLLLDDAGMQTGAQVHRVTNNSRANTRSLRKTNLVTEDFWQQTNGPFGGGVASLASDSYGYLYAACNDAGVFSSYDNGVTWKLITNNLIVPSAQALVINASNEIFLGTSNGVYQSLDYGSSWTFMTTGLTMDVSSMAINGNGYVFAGTYQNGIYRSTNNGVTWIQVNAAITAQVTALLAGTGNFVFAGTWNDGMYRSTDNGTSWTNINTGLTVSVIQSLTSSGGYLFAGTYDSGTGLGGVFRSADNGSNWTLMSNGLSSVDIQSLVSKSSGYIFAGSYDSGIFFSANYGTTWTQVNTGLTVVSVRCFTVNPGNGNVLAGTDNGGIFITTDDGGTWTQSNQGLTTFVRTLKVNTNGDIYAGTYYGGLYRSTDNGGTWVQSLSGPYYTYSLIFNSLGNIFAGTSLGVYRSTDNGSSWVQLNTGLVNKNVLAFTINASNNYIFAGTAGGVYRSTNTGANWQKVSIGLTDTLVRSLALKSSNGYIFAGTYGGGGVFRSTDGGTSWSPMNSGITNYSVIRTLTINASGQIFAGTGGDGLFRSTNDGTSWVSIGSGAGLTDSYINSLIINSNGHLFAGTPGGGAFKSTDNGNTWLDMISGLTNLYVIPLSQNANGFLYAGTGGSGVFKSNTSSTATSTINDAWWMNEIDTDGDYYYSSKRLIVNVDATDGSSHSVYLKLYQKLASDVSWTLYYTAPSFTIAGTSTSDTLGIIVGLPTGELPHNIYDFKLELFDASLTTLQSIAGPGSDPDLHDIWFETQVQDIGQPIVNSFFPTNGPVGTIVSIYGANFGASPGTSVVAFGTITASPTSWSDTQIDVPVPSGVTGNVYISVTVNSFVSTSIEQFILSASIDRTPPNIFDLTGVVPDIIINPGTIPSPVTITASATESETTVSTFILQYIREGDTQPTPINFDSPPYSNTQSKSIPGSAFISNGRARGVSYRLVATNSVNLDSMTSWKSLVVRNNFSITTTSGQLPAATAYPNAMAKAYRIFSVPYELDVSFQTPVSILSSLGPHKNNDVSYYNWRFQRWNGAGMEDIEQFGNNPMMRPGNGFFLIVRDPNKTLTIGSSRATSAATMNTTGITLQDGWNIVGTPMNMSIPWSSMRFTGSNTGHAYYDGNGPVNGWYTSGTDADTMRPWSGLAIKMNGPGTVRFNTLSPRISSGNGGRETPALDKQCDVLADPANWVVPVNAYRSDIEMRCEGTGFGMAKEANEGYDRYDSYLPPIIGDKHIAVYFKNSYDVMMRDIRPPNEEGSVWDMRVVTGDAGAKVKLQFGDVQIPNPAFEAYLIDIDQKMAHNIKEVQSLEINSGNGIRNFRIAVGKKSYIEQNNAGIALGPSTMKLYTNYPNPFNPETVIRYTVPNTSLTYKVTMKIYNVLGQEVATLVNKQQAPGYYEVKWFAQHQSSGVYFYHISVTDGNRTFQDGKKMLLMK